MEHLIFDSLAHAAPFFATSMRKGSAAAYFLIAAILWQAVASAEDDDHLKGLCFEPFAEPFASLNGQETLAGAAFTKAGLDVVTAAVQSPGAYQSVL